jgi:hypothetical protein
MAAAFDPLHHVLIVYGGRTPADTWLDDTWSWNGTTWTQLQPAQHPVLRFAMGAFDPTISKLVVYGLTSDLKAAQTWTWDGNWKQVSDPSPTRRVSSALAYDPLSRTVILFGGRSTEDLAYLADTWAFDGVSWKQIATNASPSPRQNPAMTTVSQGVLLFGGDAHFTRPADTWTWNGSAWGALSPMHTPAINGMSGVVAGMTSRNGQAVVLTYGSFDGPGQTYLFSQGDWTAT